MSESIEDIKKGIEAGSIGTKGVRLSLLQAEKLVGGDSLGPDLIQRGIWEILHKLYGYNAETLTRIIPTKQTIFDHYFQTTRGVD